MAAFCLIPRVRRSRNSQRLSAVSLSVYPLPWRRLSQGLCWVTEVMARCLHAELFCVCLCRSTGLTGLAWSASQWAVTPRHAAVLAKLCASACVFFPLVLVKGVGKTWQKHLLEMTASREAVLLLMEEAKRNGCTFERFLKWVDCKIGKIQGKSCHLRLLRWPSTLQMQKHMKDVHSANAGPHLELQGQVIFLT